MKCEVDRERYQDRDRPERHRKRPMRVAGRLSRSGRAGCPVCCNVAPLWFPPLSLVCCPSLSMVWCRLPLAASVFIRQICIQIIKGARQRGRERERDRRREGERERGSEGERQRGRYSAAAPPTVSRMLPPSFSGMVRRCLVCSSASVCCV